MVSLKDIQKSNMEFKLSGHSSNLVAVFVGATSGIGKGTLLEFAKYTLTPKIYVLCRSKTAASPLHEELKKLNPKATYEFIETEVSLMKNVDLACDEIKRKEEKVDVLFLSCGYLAMGGRQESVEGIDVPHALRYYTRLRFVWDLLPLLKSSPNPRVVSILAGGMEKEIDINDLEVKNDFTFAKAAANGTTQTTLAFEELAKENPSVSFIHKYPGFVDTGVIKRFLGTVKGVLSLPAMIAAWVVLPVVNFFSTSVEEAGERGFYLVTSARYPPAKPSTEFVGVPLPKNLHVAESSIVKDGQGNGVYRLGALDESAEESSVLVGYRAEDVGKKVWEETQAVWDRVLERTS